MRFVADEYRVYLPVTELASYAYQRENVRLLTQRLGFIREGDEDAPPMGGDGTSLSPAEHGLALHHVLQTDARFTPGVTTEVPLERSFMNGDLSVCVQGYADSISFDGRIHTVEEFKTLSSFTRGLSPFSDPAHFAQAAIYASFYAEAYALPELRIKLTFLRRSDGERVSYGAVFSRMALQRMVDSLLNRAWPFIRAYGERYGKLPDQAKAMPFPYHSIRDGQAQFIRQAYAVMAQGKNLLVSAPTGIGKTMSAIFPALKAAGDGYADRIFYCTAKTVTGQAAMEAAKLLQKHVPELRTLQLLSKDQLCAVFGGGIAGEGERSREGSGRMGAGGDDSYRRGGSVKTRGGERVSSWMRCRLCEKRDSIPEDTSPGEAPGRRYIPFKERQLAALTSLLEDENRIYTADRIRKTAMAHRVCPHELALDLSEHCPLIVCDYNYVLDERVRLRRYFKDATRQEKYIFLFDEAHNLPDRVTATYSAELDTSLVRALGGLAERELCDDGEFCTLSTAFSRWMEKLRRSCVDSEYIRTGGDGEEISGGYLEEAAIPPAFSELLDKLSRHLGRLLRDGSEFSEAIEPLYDKLSAAAGVCPWFDEKFRFFGHRDGEDLVLKLLCVDPSGMMENMLSPAVSSVLFSATLSPMDYYREVTGMRDAALLDLPSPYDSKNLCLIAYDGLSTRYNDRKATAEDCAEIIARCVEAREGNYMVYFPSYEYMKRVARCFRTIMPDKAMILQKPGMSYGERERFIRLFRSQKQALVGFCVLGGMFSEGIDLSGEGLIGSIIVGTGMPQLSAERNIMAAYYQEKTERGHEFAYVCPGMNKVMQAAGRVIRSEEDRGVVLLIDDRYSEPSMGVLYPRHWRHMRITGDLDTLEAMVGAFWGDSP